MTPSFSGWMETGHSVTLVLPRLLPMFFVLPVFGERMLTGLVRNGLIAVVAMFISPLVPLSVLGEQTPVIWMLLLIKEAALGLLLAMGASAMLWAVQNVGYLIDFQTGTGNATFFDPLSGQESGPTASFLGFLAITLFLTGGGLHVVLGALFESYRVWPVQALLPDVHVALDQFAIHEADSIMTWTVKLAAPIVLLLLVVEIGLSAISRSVPQLNIFMFSQPIKSGLAMLMMVLFLQFLYDTLRQFIDTDSGMRGLLQLLGFPAAGP